MSEYSKANRCCPSSFCYLHATLSDLRRVGLAYLRLGLAGDDEVAIASSGTPADLEPGSCRVFRGFVPRSRASSSKLKVLSRVRALTSAVQDFPFAADSAYFNT